MYKYLYEDELVNLFEEYQNSKRIPHRSKSLYISAINHFLKNFLETEEYFDLKISELSGEIMHKYYLSMNNDLRNATIINKFRALHLFFGYLYQHGFTNDIFLHLDEKNYLRSNEVKVSNALLTVSQADRLYNFINSKECETSDRLLLGLILYQGLSKGEITTLKYKNIDFDFDYIYTQKNKESSMKTKILSLDIKNLILLLSKEEKVTHDGSIFRYRNEVDSRFNRDITRITKKIIGHSITPSILREFYRIRLIENNKSKYNIVTEFLGESLKSTMDTIKKYSLVSLEDYEEDIRDMLRSYDY